MFASKLRYLKKEDLLSYPILRMVLCIAVSINFRCRLFNFTTTVP